MMSRRTKDWLKAAGIRAVKTMAQTAVAAALGEVDWTIAMSSAILAGVLSLLTSAAGLPELKGA